MSENTGITGWFSNPQNKGRAIAGSIYTAIAVAVMIRYDVLGHLVNFMDDLLHLIIVGAGVAFLITFLMLDQTRALFFYIPNMIADAIVDKVVGIDPISVLRNFVKHMKNKYATFTEHITRMQATREKNVAAREERYQQMQDCLKRAAAAEKNGMDDEKLLMLEKAKRREAYIVKIDKGIEYADTMLTQMRKAASIINFHIQNSQDQMEMLRDENDLALEMIAGAEAAQELLDTDTGKGALAQRATEVVKQRTATAKAEVDNLMNLLKVPGTEMELTRLADQEDGLRMLENFKAQVNQADEQAQGMRLLSSGPAQNYSVGSKSPTTSVWANRLKR